MKFAFALMPVLLFAAQNTIAYDLESIFQMPEWKTNHGWFENSDGNERARVYSVIMGPKETVLWIELQTTAAHVERLEYWASRNTYLQVGGTRLPYVGTRSNGKLHWTTYDDGSVAHWGWDNPERGKSYFYNLVFQGGLPLNDGFDTISLVDPGENGVRGYGLNSFSLIPNYSGANECKSSEMELRGKFLKKCFPFEGIYESTGEKCWRVACVKQDDGTYDLEFLENGYHKYWSEGDIKAKMTSTASTGLFKAKWWNQSFYVLNGVVVACDGTTLKVVSSEFPLDNGNSEMVFMKMYPSSIVNSEVKDINAEISGGTGFALKGGYLVTNNHVIDGATDVRVWREVGGAMKSSSAQVISRDKDMDLALLKSSFDDEDIPYSMATSTIDVGESVFALGFPLVQTMGKELKLTTGVISSLAGFKDDQSNYQVSVAIQPGNSGGPLFNDKGVVVGVVVAKHLGAENANYAIKSGELKKFLREHSYERLTPTGSNWNRRTLSDKVKTLREYVYRIECVNGGSFSKKTDPVIKFPEVDVPYKTKNLDGTILLTNVTLNNSETVLEFSSKSLDGCWLSPKTVIECGDKKLQLRKVVGLPSTKDSKDEIPEDWQVRSFKAYFPPVPKGVEKINFVEPNDGSGTPFVWKGIHLK